MDEPLKLNSALPCSPTRTFIQFETRLHVLILFLHLLNFLCYLFELLILILPNYGPSYSEILSALEWKEPGMSNVQSFLISFAMTRWFLNFATATSLPNWARCLSDSKLLIWSPASSSLVNELSSVARGGFNKQSFPNPYFSLFDSQKLWRHRNTHLVKNLMTQLRSWSQNVDMRIMYHIVIQSVH